MVTSLASAAHADAAGSLAGLFYDPLGGLGRLTPVGEGDLPVEPLTLLAHAGHMTVTLEAWHESLVDVKVVSERRDPGSYARHSLLTRRSDGRVVQSGVMRIDLGGLPEGVRRAVELGECPLGRILIRSNLLREVELLALWRLEAGPTLAAELEIPSGAVIHGRSARILVEGRPAVELLEIVPP